MIKVLNIVGARPNFMKAAPVVRAMKSHGDFDPRLIHTGQHYDAAMSDVFFRDLGLPAPDVNLEVGPGDRDQQIRVIMERFDRFLASARPAAVMVVGDVNSTVACARAAARRGVPVAHVEAGLRSFDLTMPEERNRIETDALSAFLFATEPSGMANLAREKVAGKAFLVGNVMIDSLVAALRCAKQAVVRRRFHLEPGGYLVGTFHRPANVDSRERLLALIDVIRFVCRRRPLVMPLHPRTSAALQGRGLADEFGAIKNLVAVEPMGYVDFLSLVHDSAGVLTDSGGLQEETAYLGIPCITMRDSTERPMTVELGTNELAGTNPANVKSAVERLLRGEHKRGTDLPLWDGRASERIVEILARELAPARAGAGRKTASRPPR